jgi:hypothetical protein
MQAVCQQAGAMGIEKNCFKSGKINLALPERDPSPGVIFPPPMFCLPNSACSENRTILSEERLAPEGWAMAFFSGSDGARRE